MRREFTFLLAAACFWLPSCLYAQGSSDLYASVEQSAVDKVVHDAHYPLTVLDQWWSFSGDNAQLSDRIVTGDESDAYLTKAHRMDCSTHPRELACGILVAVTERNQRIDAVLQLRAQTLKAGQPWKGPDQATLTRMKDSPIEVKVHLAHLKINLQAAPNLSISGLVTNVNNVSLDIDAIGELWAKYQTWYCTKTCSLGPIPYCCEGHFGEAWSKILEVDVSDVKIITDASVSFSTSGALVYATPSLQRLALDYDILRDINLAPIANNALDGQKFLVIDAGKLVEAVPYVNTKYTVKSVALSGSGEIRADIVIQKVP